MHGQNEAQVCGLQTIFAHPHPNSSKIPITEHFLSYITKFVCELRDVFHRSDPVYNQRRLPFPVKEQLRGKPQE